jgi:MFS family permease
MKVDLVGPQRRGLAIGLNESSGYLAVSAAALATGYIAASRGVRPEPFLIGAGAALAGLLLSLRARETRGHAALESAAGADAPLCPPALGEIVRRVSWTNTSLRAVSFGGLVNNLNDGVGWGLFPLLFVARGATLREVATLVAVYPAVWGLGQLTTGLLSDRRGRKWPMAGGMVMQGLALVGIGAADRYGAWLVGMAFLGVGTALVYPTFLGAVSDHTGPLWRASAIGVYRFWRDMGYALGAILAGGAADLFGIATSIHLVGALTIASGVVLAASYSERKPYPKRFDGPP